MVGESPELTVSINITKYFEVSSLKESKSIGNFITSYFVSKLEMI